ncbi:MAG: hypothetical protein L0Y74_08065, partial [candidate division Zixibacteria bacterium]|nr:hypothetical protein [candidate division Zixibacteria bacterium]
HIFPENHPNTYRNIVLPTHIDNSALYLHYIRPWKFSKSRKQVFDLPVWHGLTRFQFAATKRSAAGF